MYHLNPEIARLTQVTVYKLYSEKYPKLVEYVRANLRSGMNPDDIQKYFEKKLGNGSTTACNLGLVADCIKNGYDKQLNTASV